LAATSGCKARASAQGAPSASGRTPAPSPMAAPLSSIVVDHGELDTQAPDDAPKLAATVIAAIVYKLPDIDSRRLGYLRLGAVIRRDREPVSGKGCKGSWYRVYPMGYVCSDEATTDLESPLVRAASVRPDLSKPLPYKYGFVRATAPQYLEIPSKEEQNKSEFKLDEHMEWFAQNRDEVQKVELGSNDVPLDPRGVPKPGLKHPKGFRTSTELSMNELFGGKSESDPIPFWLEGGKRAIPNVSGFVVPDYAIFADRVRRKTGLSFVGAFEAKEGDFARRFAITVDLRLIPTTKVKPDSGSPFHGIELGKDFPIPFAWVIKRDVSSYKLIKDKDEARPADPVPRRALVPVSGKARIKDGKRFYQTSKDKTRWLAADDVAIVAPPPQWPEFAEKNEKWIDISLRQQTLVLYEGKRPWYATLVSTGRDRLGDPKTSLATPQGTFRLKSKHIAAAMDSQENSTVSGGTRANTSRAVSADAAATIERLKQAEKEGKKLGEDDRRRLLNVAKGRDPEYGITMRRGAQNFELRDVPWIQYFAAGYALHGAYWHDVFGIPRSHGCVNLSPIDARIVFSWTDPPLPDGWHGINVGADMGEGTGVYIHE
jgi:lipoprotein-anchoring transpeptidase ErfK/SrfK